MTPALWLVVAAAIAATLALWGYAWREERVAGRVVPGFVRAVAIFLVVGGLSLPALRGGPPPPPSRVALVDVSHSMDLPFAPGVAAAPTRLDSAVAAVARLRPDRVYTFGSDVTSTPIDSVRVLASSGPRGERSRLAPALQAVRLAGVDSVWVVSDGEWDDREAAVRVAQSLGLGVREIRVGESAARLGIADLFAPERVRAGDTARIGVDVQAGGDPAGLPDSVRLEIRLEEAVVARATIAAPSPGRTGRAELEIVPVEPDGRSAWSRYEIRLEEGADPYAAADHASVWIEVSESSGGAVLVSTVPDWEARFLLPGLDRLVLGGVRGFLRLGDGRFLEMGPRPRLVDGPDAVRRALARSRLLVVQADFGALPGWLETVMRAHPRKLVLPRGPGPVPGTGVTLGGPLQGEWYAMPPVPPSPAAALLGTADLDALPPVRELYAIDAGVRWTILTGNRNRRGEARPLVVADERGTERWAVTPAAGLWRWTFRGGAARQAYEGLVSGLVGWLVEDVTPSLVVLEEPPSGGRPLRWRVTPAARDLGITVTGPSGDTLWRGEWADPPGSVTGPTLPPGVSRIRVAARGPAGAFSDERPVEIVPDRRETLPRAASPVAVVEPLPTAHVPVEGRGPRPLWPFVLAGLLLCGEWVWRHRIGLR